MPRNEKGLSFYHLRDACRFGHCVQYLDRVEAWSQKRQALSLQLNDFPTLIESYKSKRTWVEPENPEITMYDPIPALRLANAFEAAAHGLYAVAEVAAGVANRITGTLPKTFNKLQARASAGTVPLELAESLGDLQWYRKVREIRTEWSHYSTVFISGPLQSPEICIFGFRGKEQRIELADRHVCGPEEFMDWIRKALATLDGLASYLLVHYVLPRHEQNDLELLIDSCVLASNRFPLIVEGRLQMRKVTVRELLAESGLIKGRDW